ncbi:hypothetical protein VTK26DRAFT_6434 [Humicola hyalothermophila]
MEGADTALSRCRVGQQEEGFMASVKRSGELTSCVCRDETTNGRSAETMRFAIVNFFFFFPFAFGSGRGEAAWAAATGARRENLGKEKASRASDECESAGKHCVARPGSGKRSLVLGRGVVERSLSPRPSCQLPRPLTQLASVSIEEAVRVHPNPGPSSTADWAPGPGRSSSGWVQGYWQPITNRHTKPLVPVLAAIGSSCPAPPHCAWTLALDPNLQLPTAHH